MSRGKFKKYFPLFKENLKIICEGITDKIFLDHFLSFFTLKYEVEVIESGSISKVVKKYRKVKALNNETICLLFIDLDDNGLKNIEFISSDFERNGLQKPNVIYYVNPVIEYLFVAIKENKNSLFTKKQDYKHDIKRLYNIDSYQGTKEECMKIVSYITQEDCINLVERLVANPRNENDLPSTNLVSLLNFLKSDE